MKNNDSIVGEVQDVDGTNVSVLISKNSLTGFIYIDGQGYRVGQIGSFVRIPQGYNNLYGIVSHVGASASPKSTEKSDIIDNRWMKIQLIGESARNGLFSRGLSQYPTIGDNVYIISEKELKNIYGQPDEPYFVKLGHITNAESIPALIDINKLITRHSAVLGTTGSGKSTTVASIIDAISDKKRYPSSRILMLDLHGEYGRSFKDKSNLFKINSDPTARIPELELYIPYWALNFEELMYVCFGESLPDKEKNMLMERIHKLKVINLKSHPKTGCNVDSLSVDSPVPFDIHKLWYDLYIETYGTYYKRDGEKPLESLAFDVDDNGEQLVGNYRNGIAPIFKNVKNEKDDPEKINHVSSALGGSGINIGRYLVTLGARLRLPRYNFVFDPTPFRPDEHGAISADVDKLIEDWIGCKQPITILDLSGVPSDIIKTVVGAVLRIIYEALFWSRNLSQGGRHRPILLVMEEAHIYLNNDKENMASMVVERIAKEGRKYGIGAMIVSQRPSEINSTILSQCGTFFALRLTNTQDRGHISSVLSDNLNGLTNMLPILKTGEAIIIGEAVKLPMRTSISPLPKPFRPDSQDPVVYDQFALDDTQAPGGWGIANEDNPNYSEVIETWRNQNPRISRVIIK
ncbi:ATPase [Rheinheimera sp. SA_1]|uniref:ATP-binding protein n=1 Tax=Rheinheimera sp. SA_1 TaxID=1827365 RepID=UPI0007FC2AD2|nr:ATP-binding protein [Rheinheimera sp. SA_1]OBP13922.1 ATPase [Rheinheimera sp. SA_1]